MTTKVFRVLAFVSSSFALGFLTACSTSPIKGSRSPAGMADISAPVVDLKSVQFSSKSVHAGGTLDVTIHAVDPGSGLRGDGTDDSHENQNGQLVIINPIGKVVDFAGWGKYDKQEDRIRFRLKINEWAMPGPYQITTIQSVIDNAGNIMESQDVRHLNLLFNVNNEKPDTTAPVVSLKSIKLWNRKVRAGESAVLTVSVSDNESGLHGSRTDNGESNQNGYLEILDPTGKPVDLAEWGAYSKSSQSIRFDIKVGRYAVPGEYKIVALRWVTDNAGNIAEQADLSKMKLNFMVENAGTPDTIPPVVDLSSIHLSTRTAHQGDSITVTVHARDGISGLRGDGSDETHANQNGYLEIKDPNGKEVDLAGWGMYDRQANLIRFEVRIGKFALPGIYQITGIRWVTDNAGNRTDNEGVRDQGLKFEVLN